MDENRAPEIIEGDRPVPLTFAGLHRALLNVGVDDRCGTCAEVFWTGISIASHDPDFYPGGNGFAR